MRFWPNIERIYDNINAEDESFADAFSDRGTQIFAAYLVGIFVGVLLAILASHGS